MSFPRVKVNIIVQLEFKLDYCNDTVQHVNHYTMGTPPLQYYFIGAKGDILVITIENGLIKSNFKTWTKLYAYSFVIMSLKKGLKSSLLPSFIEKY